MTDEQRDRLIIETASDVKICKSCNQLKPLSDYNKHVTYKDGLNAKCRVCQNKIRRKWRKAHPDSTPENRRKRLLKELYNITLFDYNKIFVKQKGCCAICGRHQSELKRILHIDHDHKTDKIRGLLCSKCNLRLGWYEKNKELDFISKADTYLNRIRQ
jgi:ERCC4-type nuclease